MFQSPSLRGSGRFALRLQRGPPLPCFNPLHCGAVVASPAAVWRAWREAAAFQSPSLRGSGRFARRRPAPRSPRPGFNPLHCGAVVASMIVAPAHPAPGESFNPLHCGAVVASERLPPPKGGGEPCFNPLHCGAVVASGQRRKKWICSSSRFNPLHCGAVVASGAPTGRLRSPGRVSIPFIAGQWSLPRAAGSDAGASQAFQSPSLRGSGRFRWPAPSWAMRGPRFNPLHCGAVVASQARRDAERRAARVSIPFIAGQWSLHGDTFVEMSSRLKGFNPLHCGAVVAS